MESVRIVRDRGANGRRSERAIVDSAKVRKESAESGKKCSKCKRVKTVGQFTVCRDKPSGLHCWCKQCVKIGMAEYRRTAKYRAWLDGYQRPEKPKEPDEKLKARKARYATSIRGKLIRNRWKAMRELRDATDPARITRLAELVAMHDRELGRVRFEESKI